MKKFIKSIEKNVLGGQAISYDEVMKLADIEEKEDILELCKSANKVRQYFCGVEVDLCTIMNAKSGRCTEDCKFCAQSAHYKTNVEEYGLVSKEAALKLARENEKEGVNRFSLVTSGRGATGSDFEKILDIYEDLNKEMKVDLCASLGILGYEH